MSDERLHAAYALHQQGRLAEAAIVYREILASDPRHFNALLYYGLLHLQGGHAQQAEKILDQALALNPDSFDGLSMRADALQSLARADEAIALLEKALALRPDHAVTWNNRGNLLLERGRIDEAVKSYERALALNPDYAEAWHNRAVARMRVSDDEGAISDLHRALALKPDYADATEHLGIALARLGRHEDALARFDETLAREPGNVEALKSRGALLNRLQRYADAVSDFDGVLSLRNDDADAWLGRGVALACLNHDEEAVKSFTETLRLRPEDPDALYNRASRYSRLARYGDAARDTETLLAIDPHYPFARGLLMHSRLHICNWRDLAETRRVIAADLEAGHPAVHPFIHLAFSESPAEQLQCARLFAAKTYPASPKPMSLGARYRHEKIRIAYLSGDYYKHAVAFLMAGVFEHHDQGRFETFGISVSPDDGSEMRTRLEKGFTRFIDVREMGDEAVAAMLRELEIDIAVDLKGYTGGCRPGILAHRPAPVQAQYLGYPGTMGADYIDYLIADNVVIPEEHRASYAEKIVYLPDMYQCNDSRRRIADRVFSRAEAGLPEKGFVFCCFNGSQKIMPETFGVWMELLAKIEDSVLWLLEEHPVAAANLRREAQAHGVSPSRLVFAKRMSLEDHLARLKLADLVLDTLPYGAHTTASDALWAGVPVLTRTGGTFAGRVATSLLNAVGLPELAVSSLPEYEALALDLARNGSMFAALKAKLAENRETWPLFDTARVTRHLETIYAEMHRRHLHDEAPAPFAVA